MKQKYKVSVILPVYNAETYVERTIISLVQQSYRNIEIIIIDDGSNDNSLALCLEMKQRYSWIQVLTQKNSGVSCARNKGISIAKGELVVFVDSDDYLPVDGIAQMVYLYEKYGSELVCCSYTLIKTRNRILEKKYSEQVLMGKEFYEKIGDLITEMHYAPWAKLYEMKIIKENSIKFPEQVTYAEDGIFLFTYLKYIRSLCLMPINVYFYNFTDANSAARKYKVDYCQYLKRLLDVQIQFLQNAQIKNGERYVSELQRDYFYRSINHYVIHESVKERLADKICLTAQLFPDSRKDPIFGIYVCNKQWMRIARKWKRNNAREYFIEVLKIKIHRICSCSIGVNNRYEA